MSLTFKPHSIKNTCALYRIFLCVSTIFLMLYSHAQEESSRQIDSIIQSLPKIKTDQKLIIALNELASHFAILNPDSGLYYAKLALKKSQEINWKKGEVNSLNSMGENYYRKGAYDRGLAALFESINLNAEVKDPDALVGTYHTIALIYINTGDNQKALKYVQDEMNILKKGNDKIGLASAYLSMGIVQQNLGNFTEALKCNAKTIELASEIDDPILISYAYSNSGSTYQQLGQYKEALKNHFKALKIEESLNDIYGMGTEYGSISDAYIGIYKQETEKHGNSSANYLDSAIYYAQKGIEYCLKCGDISDMVLFHFTLSEAYSLKKDFKKAFEIFKEGTTLKDSIFSVEKQSKLREVESKQQALLSEKEIELIHAQKELERNYYIAGGVCLLLLMLAIVSRLQVMRKTKRKLEENNAIITREKKRSEELLLNILPQEVAEELKAKGEAEARLMDHVTVIFTDFKGFTQLSERVTPKELVRDLHECFSAFDHICQKHNLEKIKTIGDAYMAAGGLPTANDTHPADAVKAGLEMTRYIEAIKARKKAEGLPYFEIRIGIHSGPVVAGIVGIKKFQYDIWGDTVNMASRLESSGEPGKVNISYSTYEKVKDQFKCIHRGKIQAKGKGEIDMYFIDDSNPSPAL